MVGRPSDDWRRTAIRLAVFTGAITLAFLAAGGGLLVHPGRPEREVPGDGGDQPPAPSVAARAARHPVRSQAPADRGEPATRTRFPSCASTAATSTSPSRCSSAVTGRRREGHPRDDPPATATSPATGPSSSSTTPRVDQVRPVLARRLDFELPGIVVERVPTRRYPAGGLGAHLLGLRRRGERVAGGAPTG